MNSDAPIRRRDVGVYSRADPRWRCDAKINNGMYGGGRSRLFCSIGTLDEGKEDENEWNDLSSGKSSSGSSIFDSLSDSLNESQTDDEGDGFDENDDDDSSDILSEWNERMRSKRASSDSPSSPRLTPENENLTDVWGQIDSQTTSTGSITDVLPPPSPPAKDDIMDSWGQDDFSHSTTTLPENLDFESILQTYNPNNPPPPTDLPAFQIWLECQSHLESLQKYSTVIQSARDRQDYLALTPVQRLLSKWYQPVRDAIETEQRSYLIDARGKKDRVRYGAYLCSLKPEKLAIITAHEVTSFVLKSGGSAKLAPIAIQVGEAVEAEVNVQRLLRQRMLDNAKKMGRFVSSDEEDENGDYWYSPVHLDKFVKEANGSDSGKNTRVSISIVRANRRARRLLRSTEDWDTAVHAKVGVALISSLIDNSFIKDSPAFTYEKKWMEWNKKVGHISVSDDFYKMVIEEKYEGLGGYCTRLKPMVIPPNPWTGPRQGAYLMLKADLMRTHGCGIQKHAMREADLDVVYRGLNSLGNVPWRINTQVLEAAQSCWENGVVLGDIPSRVDYEVPPAPEQGMKRYPSEDMDKDSPEYVKCVEEYLAYRDGMLKHRRVHQRNMDLRGLRCSTLLKLHQAEQFKGFEKIYFPYNLDFRGRAYPVPPHLSNVGSDLCRGMLLFHKKKPLGSRGLYWLKVHLANLAGKDKLPFDERAQFTEDHMEHIFASAKNPTEDPDDPLASWWKSAEDPFQALGACKEIVAAMESGDPESYESNFPVHMDGSCNGLQHYAALGLDSVGGEAVNLVPSDAPQDVYSGVMKEVIRQVEAESNSTIDFDVDSEELTKEQKTKINEHEYAKLLNGYIDRGVVKRTVMTSVYGVTYIGARKQIKEKLEEKLKAAGHDIDEIEQEIHRASGYLAKITMDVMGELFTGARQTMNWLTECARLVARTGQPISWISPIGVPVVQPYRQHKRFTIITLVQTLVLAEHSDALPIHKQRQVSAFPPNYVHSLDSSHMLLTALEMEQRGLTFSAVHDSFWTHPCDVDEMNEVLRDTFVDLYKGELLEELKKSLEMRYPDIVFPEMPARGTLNLDDVKKAPYFFQ